jgi:transposase
MEISPEAQAQISALQEENALLKKSMAALEQMVATLRQEVADLRRQLGKDSTNSSKPPSSDGFKKKPRILSSPRDTSEKKSGGQAGHKGDTLKRIETPDKIEHHTADTCKHCTAGLTVEMVIGVEKRQVFDIPEPRLECTEHQADIYACACCHGTTKAAFPEGVVAPVQYGPRVRAAAIYLNVQHLIPEDRMAEVMGDLFAAPSLCPASLVSWEEKKAAELGPVVDRIQKLLILAPVRHLDETGFRIGGKGKWLHTASTAALTHYRVTEKRGDVATIFTDGIIVHDHFKPYYTLPDVAHALCNAHHLRELKALIEIEKEPWAKRLFRVLLKTLKAVKRAIEKGDNVLTERVLRRIERLYDGIISVGLSFHESLPPLARKPGARGKLPRRVGHNLLIRLRDFRSDVLRFIFDFRVPFTNNIAEQAFRMMKVKMKISGGFRTLVGAQTFATLRSVISTARKQGWNILDTLIAHPQMLIIELSG